MECSSFLRNILEISWTNRTAYAMCFGENFRGPVSQWVLKFVISPLLKRIKQEFIKCQASSLHDFSQDTGNKQEVQQELGLMEIGEDLCQDLLLLNPKILHGLRLLILLRDTMVQKTCVVSRLGLFCPTLMTNSHSNWFRKIVVKLNH